MSMQSELIAQHFAELAKELDSYQLWSVIDRLSKMYLEVETKAYVGFAKDELEAGTPRDRVVEMLGDDLPDALIVYSKFKPLTYDSDLQFKAEELCREHWVPHVMSKAESKED